MAEHEWNPRLSTMQLRGALCCTALLCLCVVAVGVASSDALLPLRFNEQGQFKILQIADMHYANGLKTECKDVLDWQMSFCSDLNTTAFVTRLIVKEKPDLVVFTGDNIDGSAVDAAQSMDEAFSPVIAAKIPWAAVLGNHDDEANLARPDLMSHLSGMQFSLARAFPQSLDGGSSGDANYLEIAGVGNYNLEVFGPLGSVTANTSLLNLFFLDSGAYSKVPGVDGYDWIRASQQVWFEKLSKQLSSTAPGLAYFHIPVPEYDDVVHISSITGQHQESVCSASINSGFFASMLEAADVQAAFVGHDHVNDYCGDLLGIQLCYAGGTGYHGYGKAGWPRRARVVVASLGIGANARQVQLISTWKDLDDQRMSQLHVQVLWDRQTSRPRARGPFSMWRRFPGCSTEVLVAVSLGVGIPMFLASLMAVFLWHNGRRLKAVYAQLSETSSLKA